MKELKNYLLVTIEKRFVIPNDGFSAGGFYNAHFIECQFQSKKSCEKYREEKSLWQSVVMTKRQYELSVKTTGLHTI